MTKTRSFSIFLLKEPHTGADALKEDTDLEAGVASDHLPEGASLYVLDNVPKQPWWKTYFGVQKDLWQASKGAIVFLPAGGRCFALCFGHVYHNLQDTSYEYDFGLRVTLNCVDPDKLKSTDILEPSGAKRQRTQLPTVADLTFFDVDADSTILKSLTGKVKKSTRMSSSTRPAPATFAFHHRLRRPIWLRCARSCWSCIRRTPTKRLSPTSRTFHPFAIRRSSRN